MKKENNTAGEPGHRLNSKYADSRQSQHCVYCGGKPETRDHAPPKIFLDLPYPPDLPVVPACKSCNLSFSENDLYIACLIECAKYGSLNPLDLGRKKIKNAMNTNNAMTKNIVHRLHGAKFQNKKGAARFKFEKDILNNLFMRLVRAHALYEFNEILLDEYALTKTFFLYEKLTPEQRSSFETTPDINFLPEIGSRAAQRVWRFRGNDGNLMPWIDWTVVEENNYRYLATPCEQGLLVRIVIHEFLAGEFFWSP